MIYEGLYTTETVPGQSIELGGLVCGSAIIAANIIRDIREHVTNTLGGRMTRYEEVLNSSVDTALSELQQKVKDAGYDGVVALRISHPSLVEGGAEVVVYGTGFRRIRADT